MIIFLIVFVIYIIATIILLSLPFFADRSPKLRDAILALNKQKKDNINKLELNKLNSKLESQSHSQDFGQHFTLD